MSNTVIVYKSVTGFTEKYAACIAAALGCEAIGLKDASAKRLSGCESLIFGSRIHAGRIDGIDKARRLTAESGAKRLILFATGGAPAEAAEVIEKMWRDNLTAGELENTPHFYMPGGLCYEKMPLVDRLIMKMAAKMMSKAEPKDDAEAGFATALSGSYDNFDEKYIAPLVDYLNADSRG